jgi:hypothetical protein
MRMYHCSRQTPRTRKHNVPWRLLCWGSEKGLSGVVPILGSAIKVPLLLLLSEKTLKHYNYANKFYNLTMHDYVLMTIVTSTRYSNLSGRTRPWGLLSL